VLCVDEDLLVTSFFEKPKNPPRVPAGTPVFASMGNYIFSTKKLGRCPQGREKHYDDLDFGKHIIPMMVDRKDKVFAYQFF